MDKETVRYIMKYFSNLLTEEEKRAWRHQTFTEKVMYSTNPEKRTKRWKEKGLLTDDAAILALLAKGYDNFELKVAERVMRERRDEIFLNNCPKCDRLARTPKARLCRHCGYSWHQLK